jgi:hypothetical protein
VAKETIDLKEIKRVDHILASLQRKVSSYTTFHRFLFKQAHITLLTVSKTLNKKERGIGKIELKLLSIVSYKII